jgi:hypothetical protein
MVKLASDLLQVGGFHDKAGQWLGKGRWFSLTNFIMKTTDL